MTDDGDKVSFVAPRSPIFLSKIPRKIALFITGRRILIAFDLFLFVLVALLLVKKTSEFAIINNQYLTSFHVFDLLGGLLFVLLNKKRELYSSEFAADRKGFIGYLSLNWVLANLPQALLTLIVVKGNLSLAAIQLASIGMGLPLILVLHLGTHRLLRDLRAWMQVETACVRERVAILNLGGTQRAVLRLGPRFQIVCARHLPEFNAIEDVLPSIEEFVASTARKNVERVFLVGDDVSEARLNQVMAPLRALAQSVWRLVERPEPMANGPSFERAGEAMAIRLQPPLPGRLVLIAKRALDLAIALPALLLLSPLFALLSLAIRRETAGPALFLQWRRGLGGQAFQILKFRSMRVMEEGDEVRQATRSDARITRIGLFLRQSCLDELPQLWNVLRGEMSLVGPRPHALAHEAYYRPRIAGYVGRQGMKPGLTGWAQIHGYRGETPTLDCMVARVDHDLWYINHYSLGLDLAILARTLALPLALSPVRPDHRAEH